MNPFSTDKAPYAVALLISALGWAFAALHGGLQDSLIAAYQVDRRGAEAIGTITNLSKTKSIGPVLFMLACEKQQPCLAENGQAAQFVMIPPTGLAGGLNEFRNPSDVSTEFTVALPPGGSVAVRATTSNNKTPVVLLMTPSADKPEAIYLLSSRSPVAWFIHRYYLLALAATTLFLIGFVVWLAHGLLTAAGASFKKGAPPDGPSPQAGATEPPGDIA